MQKFNVVKDDNDDDGLLEELGGLEDDDVWGDVEDPMAEVDKMTDE